MCAMVFLVNGARVVFAPLIQPAAADLNVTAASLGIVTTAAWLGSAAPRLPTGYLLTRFPRHVIIATTGALLVGTSSLAAFSSSVEQLAIGAFLMGLSSGMYFIAANPLVSELYPNRVGRAIGIHGVSNQLAAVSVPILVSVILLVGDWRLTFLCIAAVAAVVTVGLVWAARRTELPDAGANDRSLLVAARAQWRFVFTGIALVGLALFLWNGLFNLYGTYLETAKGIDPATGRTLLSVMFAAGVPAFFLTGRLADRVPNVPLLLGLMGAFSVSVFVLTLVEHIVAVIAVSLVVGYTAYSLLPAVDTYLLSSLPDHHRGSAYALYSSGMMFVQALGSGTVGLAVMRGFSYTGTFQTISAVVFSVMVCMLCLHRLGWLPAGGTPGQIAQ